MCYLEQVYDAKLRTRKIITTSLNENSVDDVERKYIQATNVLYYFRTVNHLTSKHNVIVKKISLDSNMEKCTIQ